MTERENRTRAWRKQTPQWIPAAVSLPWINWELFEYDINELESVCLKHPLLFPDFKRGRLKENFEIAEKYFPSQRAGEPYTDYWGSVWETKVTGMVGSVVKHPLETWDDFENFKAPDPNDNDGISKIDWAHLESRQFYPNRENYFFQVGLTHGHTFLRAQDLRGYMNLIFDMADEDERIDRLLDIICDYNVKLINRFIACKPDCIIIPEDLGMQNSPMLSVEQFRRYIAPRYKRMTDPIKRAGIIVHEHSDGYIMDLMDDIIETGGTVINLQDLVNGIDNIRDNLKGRISIDLDIDRQNITVFGSKNDIDNHIKECVSKLGSKEGGLSLFYQPWPKTPVENMDAVFTSMEKYCITDYMFK